MALRKRSIYFKCPHCGHEDSEFDARSSTTCPKCGTRVKMTTVLLPNLLVGVVLGAVIIVLGFGLFSVTGAKPLYVLLGVAPVVIIVAWMMSSRLKKHLHRWTRA